MKHRLKLRFGLQALLILIAAVSIFFGLYVRSVRNQRAAVRAIQDYGGWVRYDFQCPLGTYDLNDFDPDAKSRIPAWLIDNLGVDFFHNIVVVDLIWNDTTGTSNENSSDAVLQHLPSLPGLRRLKLKGTQASDTSLYYIGKLTELEQIMMMDVSSVTDAGIEQLCHLTNLKSVLVNNSRITDRSLAVFGRMKLLERLILQGEESTFTDEGLTALAKLSRLRRLVVNKGDCNFKDNGLSRLTGLNELETLEIRGPGVTDQGMKHLSKLSKLKFVRVSGSQVTAEGLADLQARMPAVRFEVPLNRN